MKSRNLNLLELSGPVQDCNGIALPVHLGTKNDLIQTTTLSTPVCHTSRVRSESDTSQALLRASVWATGMLMMMMMMMMTTTLLYWCPSFVSHYERCDLQTVSPRSVPTLTHRPDFYCQTNTGNSEAPCGYAQPHYVRQISCGKTLYECEGASISGSELVVCDQRLGRQAV